MGPRDRRQGRTAAIPVGASAASCPSSRVEQGAGAPRRTFAKLMQGHGRPWNAYAWTRARRRRHSFRAPICARVISAADQRSASRRSSPSNSRSGGADPCPRYRPDADPWSPRSRSPSPTRPRPRRSLRDEILAHLDAMARGAADHAENCSLPSIDNYLRPADRPFPR